MVNIEGKPGWVRIECAGGCGRCVELRLKKVIPHDFYLCDSKESGHLCLDKIPPALRGQIQTHQCNAAAAFMGVSYVWPTVL